MSWSRQQYEDRIRAALGDLGIIQHIGEDRIPLALEGALATFTKDKPRQATGTFSGDNTTQTFDLSTLAGWERAWSRVISVEYPTGDIPRSFIDSHDYTVTDDELAIHDAPATGTDNIRVRFTASWAFPDDDPSNDEPISDIHATAIADLAAARLIRGKAVEFARQQSTSVAGDLFTRDAAPLFEAARSLESAYEDTVLGRSADEEGPAPQVAMAVNDVDVFPASVFHRREEYIEEEAFGG